MRNKFLCFIVILYFLFNNISFIYADEEEIRNKYKDNRMQQASEAATVKKPTPEGSFKASFYASANGGFDNNVYLDPSRKGDTYEQNTIDIYLRYRLNDNLAIKAKTNSTATTYNRFTDLSVIDNDINASLSYLLMKNLNIEAGYGIDFLSYIKNDNATYYVDGPFAGLKYMIAPKTFVSAGYQYQTYDYQHQKIRNSSNQVIDTKRRDHRNNIIADISKSFDRLYIKVKNIYYLNDSNDEYMDYYDYDSDRVNCYINYKVFPSLYITALGGYQYKKFKSRQITTSTDKEHDNLMILGGGFQYKITKSAYLNFNYTYRQNYSNDPIQDYSGANGTIGLTIFF